MGNVPKVFRTGKPRFSYPAGRLEPWVSLGKGKVRSPAKGAAKRGIHRGRPWQS